MSSELKIAVDTSWSSSLRRPYFMAGPCSVESEAQVLRAAKELSRYPISALRGGVWKPRTRPGSFQGMGEPALAWLKSAGQAVNLPVSTEVASPDHVELCLKAGIDILWIGARTTVSPFAVQEIADALKGVDIPVFVKNPVSPDLELWIGALERINKAGIGRLGAMHRGFTSGRESAYRNPPTWALPLELKRRIPDLPIICDPSHICGSSLLILTVAQEALDLLFDGLIIEVHPDPASALSDKQQQITPDEYGKLLKTLRPKRVDSEDSALVQTINRLRKEIDEVDSQLIELLGKRMEIVRELGKVKRTRDVSVYQPQRWDEIVKTRVSAGVQKHLSEDFVLQVYEQIHEEAVRQQEEISERKE